MNGTWPKVFCDPIHKLIAFEDNACDRLLLDLVNTREVQRLRRIKQLGLAELVFPGANHSRFSHSLGVLHTARLFLDQLERIGGQALALEHRAFLLAAALLHDIGHGPFSHVFEQITGQRHEAFTRAIIQSDVSEVNQCLRAFDPRMPEHLAGFFDDDAESARLRDGVPSYFAQVIAGQLDADRCDYLLRDSHATGTNFGNFDLAWMLAQLRPDPAGNRIYLTHKGISSVETYLFARYHMYRTVYFHKTSRAAEVMLKLLLSRVKDLIDLQGSIRDVHNPLIEAFTGQMSLTGFVEIDDHTVIEFVKECARGSDPILTSLANGLLDRRLFKALDVTGMLDAREANRLSTFDTRIRERMVAMGLDPRYCWVEDSASNTPYEPYHPDIEKPARQIFVENRDGRIVEISTISDALMLLRKPFTVMRYYAPAPFRSEMVRIAGETLWKR